MYTKRDLGARVAFWLAMAPMGGFFNGIIAYGVSFIHSHLESWRILFLIEGLMTIFIAVIALLVLPEKVETARWLNDEEKDYCQYTWALIVVALADYSVIWRRTLEISSEDNAINWKHARAALWRWQTILRTSFPDGFYQTRFDGQLHSCIKVNKSVVLR